MDENKEILHPAEMTPRDDVPESLPATTDTAIEAAPPELPPVDVEETVERDGHREEEIRCSEPMGVAEKRTRLVTVGLTTAVILSLIAVMVAGVFRLTSAWFLVSPEHHSSNGPTPILWNQMVSEKVNVQPLGVPKSVSAQVGLKDGAVPQEESASEAAKTQK